VPLSGNYIWWQKTVIVYLSETKREREREELGRKDVR
jgi:hypothetical protein